MVIAITGGSGFIGSNLADILLDQGYDIKIIDIVRPHRKDIKYINVDITKFQKLKRALKDTEFIYHLAAVSNVNEVCKNPLHSVNTNILATANVLESARQLDMQRVLFASTIWVYGASRNVNLCGDIPFFPQDTRHIYTSSKISSEMLCHNYQKLYNVPFTIMRYGTPYGPRARQEMLIPTFIKKALVGEPLTILGDSSQARKFVYIEDLVKGNALALKKIAKNKVYNFDGKEKITIKKVAELIRKIVGDYVKIQYKPARPGDFKYYNTDSRRTYSELGWKPEIDFEEGLKRYFKWFKKNL